MILGERFTDRSEKIDIQVPKINTQNEKENKTIHGLNQKYFREGQADFEKAEKEYGNFETDHYQVLGDYQKIVDDNRFLVIERQITQTAADSHVEKDTTQSTRKTVSSSHFHFYSKMTPIYLF